MTHATQARLAASLPEATILIVGGGYAGTALAIRLLERHRDSLRLVIAEPREDLGRGEAYETTEHSHLMNGPAGNFSIHPHDLTHLARWVERTQAQTGMAVPPEGADNLFIARHVFGRYVGEALAQAVQEAGPNVSTEHWRTRVTQLRQGAGGDWVARGVDGRVVQADLVVLATGVHVVDDHPALAAFANDWRVAKPWLSDRLDRLREARDVLIVGASLSMVDAVASLESRGFAGTYHVISRHGYEIDAWRSASEPADILNPEALPDTVRALLSRVQQVRHRLLADGGDWQAIPAGLRAHIPTLWRRASTAERLRFVRHLGTVWSLAAHRCAPPSHARLSAARDAGRWISRAARLIAVQAQAQDQRLAVTVLPRGTSQTQVISVDGVIDARGHQAFDWSRVASPLAQDLLSSGVVRRHATGFGIDATVQGQVIGRDAVLQPGLYAIGHPLRGVAWESSSLTEQRAQALALADLLAGILRHDVRAHDLTALRTSSVLAQS